MMKLLFFSICFFIAYALSAQSIQDFRLSSDFQYGYDYGKVTNQGNSQIKQSYSYFTNIGFALTYVHQEKYALSLGYYAKEQELVGNTEYLIGGVTLNAVHNFPVLFGYQHQFKNKKLKRFTPVGELGVNVMYSKRRPFDYSAGDSLVNQDTFDGVTYSTAIYFDETPRYGLTFAPQMRVGVDFMLDTWVKLHCRWVSNSSIFTNATAHWEDRMQGVIVSTGSGKSRGTYHFVSVGLSLSLP